MSTPTSYHLPHGAHLMLDNPPFHRSQPRNTHRRFPSAKTLHFSYNLDTPNTATHLPHPSTTHQLPSTLRVRTCYPFRTRLKFLLRDAVLHSAVLQGSFRPIHESRGEETRSLGEEKSISDYYYGCRKNNAISAFLHEPAAGLGVGSCARDPCCPSLSRSSVGVNGQ